MATPAIKYFFSEPPVKSKAFTVRGLGIRQVMRPGIVDRPGGTGDYLFMFFYDAVDLRVGGPARRFAPGHLMVWEPPDAHYYGNRDITWTHSWIHCDGSRIRDLLARNRIPLRTPIHLPDSTIPEKYLVEMHMELTGYVQPDEVIVRNEFHNWLRQIARVVHGRDKARASTQRMIELRHFLDTTYNRKLTLNALARRSGISVPHLCSEFKKQFGVAPIQYVIALRMTRAAYLLRDLNLNIAQIAEAVGYEDIFHFSRSFKKHHGTSPTAMRRAIPGSDSALRAPPRTPVPS